MNSPDVNNKMDDKAEHGRESSNFTNKLRFMRRIKKPEKRRPTIPLVHNDVIPDGHPKEIGVSPDIITTKLAESQDKITKSLTEENDSLRNKNTTLRYQVELLSEQLNDLRDTNMDLRSQNSRIREENSILRNEQSQLTTRYDCLEEQLIVLQKMLEDMGISMDEVGECGLNGNSDLPTESAYNVAPVEDTVSCNGNSGATASHRKPPANCDNNNFL